MNATTLQKIKAIKSALITRPMTLNEIAASIPMTKRWARPYVQMMHEANAVYIQAWTIKGGPRPYPRPVYALGMGKDKTKPDCRSREHLNRLRRESLRRNGERRDRENAKKRAARLKPTRDPLVSALFGATA